MTTAGGEEADWSGLLSHLGDLQRQVAEAQSQLGSEEVEGSAGGGAVTVPVSGELSFTAVHIDEAVVATGQAQLVEDLVLAALRDAATKLEGTRERVLGATMGGVMGALFAGEEEGDWAEDGEDGEDGDTAPKGTGSLGGGTGTGGTGRP